MAWATLAAIAMSFSEPLAIDVLRKRIYEAWRGRRVLLIAIFDVQRALKGVHLRVLYRRLIERKVP